MTKKDYIVIAAVLKKVRTEISTGLIANEFALEHITNGLCRALAEDNPRFDSERFEAAAL